MSAALRPQSYAGKIASMEIKDVASLVAAAFALVFGTRLWLRDGRKDGGDSVRAFVRLETAVEGLHTRLAEMRAEVHGLAARMEARDVSDHEAVQRELDHVRSEIHELGQRVARAESWQTKASTTGAFPAGVSTASAPMSPASRR